MYTYIVTQSVFFSNKVVLKLAYIEWFTLYFSATQKLSNKCGIVNEDRKIVDNIVNEIRKGKVLRRLSMKRKVTDAEIAAEGNKLK